MIDLAEDLWSQPVTDGKYLFISSLDHSLIALDKDTYRVVWQEDLGSAITSPPLLASDGSLYVGTFASNLEKFDPATGSHEPVQKTTDWVWGTPSEVESNLYFGDLSGNLYAYNMEGESVSWDSTTIPPDGWNPTDKKTADLKGGEKESLDLSGLKAGDYTIYCAIPGHEGAGMKGTLMIGGGHGGGAAILSADVKGLQSFHEPGRGGYCKNPEAASGNDLWACE